MKKLLYILCLSITAFTVNGQVVQTLGAPGTTVEVKGILRADSLFIIPNRNDTFVRPGRPGGMVFAYGKTWLFDGNSWILLTGVAWGSIPGNIAAQVDLMALFNGKQTKLSNGYGWVIDTIAWKGNFDSANVRKIDTVGRLNDSTVFYKINGHQYTFLLRGSASGTVVNAITLNAPGTLFNASTIFVNASGAWTGGLSLNNQASNTVFMGPTSGPSAAPTFRVLTIADLPTSIPNGNLANSSISFSLGTSGSSPNWNTASVALGGTALLNLPVASNITSGILSTADWIRFNSLVASSVISVNGQTGVVVTLNADSIFGQLVDTTVRRNNYALLYDSVNRKYYFGPNSGGGGAGSVTTVSSGNIPNLAAVSVATPSSTPAFSFTLNSQAANLFFASPNGSSGTPTWRALLSADFPTSGITAGTYNNVTFNNKGIATTGSNVSYITLASLSALTPALYNNTTGAISIDTSKGLSSAVTWYQVTQLRDTVNLRQVGAGINPLYTSALHDTLKQKGLNGSTLIGISRANDSSLVWSSLLNAQQSLVLSGVNINLLNDITSPGNSFIYSTNSSGVKGWNVYSSLPVATASVAGLESAADKTTLTSLGTAAFLNVPAFGNATAGQVVIGNDTRLAPTLTNTPAPANVAIGISSGTGTTLPATTSVNAGVMVPAYKARLDSIAQFSDSIRIYRKPGTDSVMLCITPISTGIEACAFQFHDSSLVSGGGGPITLTGDVLAGPGTGSMVATLAAVNSNIGTFGDGNHVAVLTVDNKGRITGVSNVAIAGNTTNLGNVPNTTGVQITSSNGTPTTIPGGTESAAGVITAAQVKRLDSTTVFFNAKASGADSISYSILSTGTGIPDSLGLRGFQYLNGNGVLVTDNSTQKTIIKTFTVDTSASTIHPATQGFVSRAYTPLTATVTINGVTLAIGTNPSFTVGSGFTNPMTTLGDLIYGGASGTATRVAGNITAAKQFFTQTGTGAVSAAPAWYTPVAADVAAWQTFTSENVANKSTVTTLGASNTLYPSQLAVKTYVDNQTTATLTLTNKSMSGASNTFTAIPLTSAVTGLLPVANGGTGVGTLTGYVFGNGTAAMTASTTIPGTAITGNISGNAGNVTGTVLIANGGTGQNTAAAALTALGGAPLASPTFTGVPAGPTAVPGTSTTQFATTAFVTAAVSVGSQNISNTNLTMQSNTTLTGNNKILAFGSFGGGSNPLSNFQVWTTSTIDLHAAVSVGSDITIGGHLIGGSGNPTTSTLGANVTSVSFSSTSNDLAMTVTVVTSGNVSGTFFTILPASPYSTRPVPVISCADFTTVNATNKIAIAGINTGSWRLDLSANITGAGTYTYNILVAQ